MKRAVKIVSWILAALLILVLGVLTCAQSPRIQTYLAHKAIDRFRDSVDGDITVSSVAFRPFDALVFKDFTLIDRHPYVDSATCAPVDTILYVHSLSSRFSIWELLRGRSARIHHLTLEDGQFNLVMEPEEGSEHDVISLLRVLRIRSSGEDNEIHFGKLLKADHVDVNNIRFRMVHYPMAARLREKGYEPVPATAVDWTNLDLTASLHIRHLDVADDVITGTLESGEILEKSGFHAKELSGKVRVGKGEAHIGDFRLRDSFSDLHLKELVLYGTLDDYSDFIENVRLEARISSPSVVSMKTVQSFIPVDTLPFSARMSLRGEVSGPVNNLSVRDLAVNDLDSGVTARIDGAIRGLPDIETTRLDFQVRQMQFDLKGLGTFVGGWAPGTHLDLGGLGKGMTFTLDADVKGLLDLLKVNGDLRSSEGTATANLLIRDILDRKNPISIGGEVRTRDLNVGRIIGTDAVHSLTMETALEARLAPDDLQVRIDSLQISRLQALGYNYSGIAAVGTYSEKAFDGRIICNDPNLNFMFQGLFNLSPRTRNAAYQFYANVGYADLNALQLDKRGKSKVSLQTNANFIKTRQGDMLGEVRVAGITLENDQGRHDIGDIVLESHANEDINRIRFTSSFADGTFVGEKSALEMIQDLKYLIVDRELPALSGDKPRTEWEGSPYEVRFTFHDSQPLLNFVLPGLYVEKGTSLVMNVEEDGTVDASVQSGRIALEGNYLKDLQLDISNQGGALHADIASKIIQFSGIELKNNGMTLFADDGHIGLGYIFDNETELDNRGEFYLSGDLLREEDGVTLKAQALPSNIYYNGNGWSLHSDDIILHGDGVSIDSFRLENNEQSLLLDGGFSKSRADTVHVRMEKFDISLLNSVLSGFDLQGRATGRAMVISPSTPSVGLLAGITCDSTSIAGFRAGQVRLTSVWNEPDKSFKFSLRNWMDGQRNVDLSGFLRPSDKAVGGEVKLSRLDLGYAAPILEGLFSEFRGFLSGQIKAGGTLEKPKISSEGLHIDDGRLTLDFSQVCYLAQGDVSLSEKGLFFDDLRISDGKDGTGSVGGSILIGRSLSDLTLDTHIRFDRMHVLNLAPGMNNLFYGDIYAGGRVDATGSLDKIDLVIDAESMGDGNFHLPLGGFGSAGSQDLLTFTQPYVEEEIDPYELLVSSPETGKTRRSSNVNIKLRVKATPDVTAYIDIGDNSLTGTGAGIIEIDTSLKDKTFSINGDYTLNQGNFHFSALNLVSREFTIRSGSSVRFGGAVMDTDLNVDAVYVTKAPLGNLLSDSTSVARRTVECGIKITDKLRNPDVKLSINIPDLDPATAGEVQSALNTDDKVQKQFIYLLIAGNFLPPENSGITNTSSSTLYSNVAGIMAGQLSSIFQKLDIPLDLGLNYQPNERGNDLFDVALSTQLFMGRVLVNGTIGNRRYSGGTYTNEVSGDLDIEIKLNKPGTFRLNLFSHSADQYTSFLDNSQRNGLGVAYQREFNTFKELGKTFIRKKETEESTEQESAREVHLSIGADGKAKTITEDE